MIRGGVSKCSQLEELDEMREKRRENSPSVLVVTRAVHSYSTFDRSVEVQSGAEVRR